MSVKTNLFAPGRRIYIEVFTFTRYSPRNLRFAEYFSSLYTLTESATDAERAGGFGQIDRKKWWNLFVTLLVLRSNINDAIQRSRKLVEFLCVKICGE